MQAILFATGKPVAGAQSLPEGRPAALLPLVDRPVIQHVIENLVGRGVTEISVVLSLYPEQFSALLGDGSRWGCRIETRLVRSEEQPYGVLRALVPGPATMLLLGHADRLPAGVPIPCPDSLPHALLEPPTTSDVGSGWGWVPAAALDQVRAEWDESAFCAWLGATAQRLGTLGRATAMLSVRSLPELLASQRLALDGDFPGLLLDGGTAEPGIRLCRNAVLHPTARLLPPVFIGPDCNIGRGVVLGPNVVVQPRCVLDDHCSASDALVLSGSYVGESLELSQVLVDRNRLMNAKYGTELAVSDTFILGAVAGGSGVGALLRGAARIPAALLFLLCLPVLAVAALWRRLQGHRPVVCRRAVVRLPAPDASRTPPPFELLSLAEPETLTSVRQHFLLVFLPGLLQVISGKLAIVGIRPLRAAELEAMGADRRGLCLRTKAGLVTEALLVYGPSANDDDQYSAEAVYAVRAGMGYDARLLARYLLALLLPRP
jgi:hypothetical protein